MIDRGGGSTPPKRPRPPLSLMDVNTRHQVHIEQLKASIVESFQKFLKSMKADIIKRLPGPDDIELRDFTRLRMEKMLGHVHQGLQDRYGKYYGVWREQIVDFGAYEAEFQAKTAKEIFDIDFDFPTRAQLRSAILSPITGMSGINNGMTPRELYADWVGRGVKRVEGIISRGYYQGLTTQQIVREVVGTKSAHYNSGELARLYRDMETMTRTVVQHAATQARIETLRENDDVVSQLQVVATLDDRTSLLCMSMDGKLLDLDSNNLPPYHPGCRTTIVPVLKPPFDKLGEGGTRMARGADGSEVVPADMTYFEFLKTQPREFVESALGPKRAALLLDGKITAERFNELNLNRNFEPRTLAEIKALDPLVFENAENAKQLLTSAEENSILDITNANTLEELSNFAKAQWGVESIDIAGLDARAVKGTFEAMDKVFRDYPVLAGKVKTIDTNTDKVMTTEHVGFGDYRIAFNPTYYSDIENIKREYADKASDLSHYFPAGTNWTNVGVHELGHVLHGIVLDEKYYDVIETGGYDRAWVSRGRDRARYETAGQILDVAWKNAKKAHPDDYPDIISLKIATNEISEYAIVNNNEAIAEAFGDVRSNGKNANKLSIEIVKELIRRLK
jgi:SPP1 gp7 family putative phage head morphogenesis protein